MFRIFYKVRSSIANPILSVFIAFFLGGILILCMGANPFQIYFLLIYKSFFTIKGFMETLHYAAPLLLTGLAIAITFKANVYNMGVEGQMLLGGFFAGIVAAYFPIRDGIVMKLVCFLIAACIGAGFACIPAILKVKCRVNEMVVTLMLNYVILKVLEFLTTGIFRDTSAGYVATPIIQNPAMFARFHNTRMTFFVCISFLILVVFFAIMEKSSLGFEIKAIGKNAEFAEACGMYVGRKIIYIMMLSGALSGVAGAGWMLSDQFRYTLGFSGNPGLGWDGMLISLLGMHSPIGIFFSSLFYSALKIGSDNINMYTDMPKEIIEIIQACIILLLAVRFISLQKNQRSKI